MAHSRGDTRARILHTAAELFQRQGYGATGLNQVLTASGAPKGSLYFHFPDGKEQLAAEAMALAGAEMAERMAEAAAAATGPAEAIAALGALLAQGLEDSDYRDGCPIATVALEEAGDTGPIHDACQQTYELWLLGLGDQFRGRGLAEQEAQELADLAMSSLQGALLLARVRRDTAVIHTVARRVGAIAAQGASDR
ncbi:TetR family transcriptional regulator [Streptomyces decoyicus]|uniref:LmrA/YxaF family transcription factor n=1 Tax=Streptomyces decoyicus TaxID=249567 RepID=UPI003643D2E1